MSKGIYVGAALVGISFSLLFAFSGKYSRAEVELQRPAIPELSEFYTIKHHTEVLNIYSLTDEVSGCQYIVVNINGPAITPRLDANGQQMCRKVTP